MLHGRLMKAGFVAALLSACFGNAQVRPAECDASLPQVNTPLGYRNRGDRCEGVYVKEVSSTPLTIRSFTDGSASYEEGDPTAESSHHSFSPTGGVVRVPGTSEIKLEYLLEGAVYNSWKTAVEILLAAGTDPNVPGYLKNQETGHEAILSLAKKKGDQDIVTARRRRSEVMIADSVLAELSPRRLQ